MTLWMWLMYLVHTSGVSPSQNCKIPSMSSCLLCGFFSPLRNCFMLPQTFSIGLRSGDSGGVCHQLMPLSCMMPFASREVCFGSLSCINRWPSLHISSRTSVRQDVFGVKVGFHGVSVEEQDGRCPPFGNGRPDADLVCKGAIPVEKCWASALCL